MCRVLKDKVAIVTGGSKGIGEAIALRFAQEGAKVLVTARNQRDLDRVVGKLNELGSGSSGFVADITDENQVRRLQEFACRTYAAVDILVNNAGLYPVTPLADLSLEEWRQVLDTNLTGVFMCSKVFAAAMIERGTPGKIVNISSTSSLLARPGVSHYASSKAGLNTLTKVLAVELAEHGIRVNAVVPGLIGTERVLQQADDPATAAEHAAKFKRIPLGRLGKPEEIAAATLFLVSSEADYITGATLVVDGGYTLGIPRY